MRAAIRLPVGARVAVAMSGGVDSSVAAGLLVEAGYQVVGLTARLHDMDRQAAAVALRRPGTCCAPEDARDARAVARQLGIHHYVIDERAIFEQSVIEPFVAAWRRGETPNPCVECNRTLKFDHMVKKAGALGAEALVTGHYARLELDELGEPALRRGVDSQKDQAYFLYPMSTSAARMLRFPLGSMAKEQVRAHAERMGLPVAAKRESMDVCFVEGGNTATWVARRDGARPGTIVDVGGMTIGQHQNLAAFTVGQRRGLHLDRPGEDGQPRYVLDKLADATVVVGPRAMLAVRTLEIAPCSAISGTLPTPGSPCEVQLRHRGQPAPATVIELQGARLTLRVHGKLDGAARGQSAVLFEGDRVLGGGLIVGATTAGSEAVAQLNPSGVRP